MPARPLPAYAYTYTYTHMHTDMTLHDLALVVPMNNTSPGSLVSLLPVHCFGCPVRTPKSIISAGRAAFVFRRKLSFQKLKQHFLDGWWAPSIF